MIRVTNPRLKSVEPLRWAQFRGVTVLFDNADAGLASDGLEFYDRLETCVERYFGDVDAVELGCLPRPSYHVTLLDLVNDGNLSRVNSAHRESLRQFIEALPESLRPGNPERAQAAALLDLVMTHELLMTPTAQLEFDVLEVWAKSVLVARLKLDAAGRKLAALRGELNDEIARTFGVQASAEYRPHVSLGYFANPDAAERAHRELDGWTVSAGQLLKGCQLRFTSASVYGFTALDGFIRLT